MSYTPQIMSKQEKDEIITKLNKQKKNAETGIRICGGALVTDAVAIFIMINWFMENMRAHPGYLGSMMIGGVGLFAGVLGYMNKTINTQMKIHKAMGEIHTR